MSYAAKWVETSVEYQNTSVLCPALVEPELENRTKRALQAFRAVGAKGYARDMHSTKTASRGCSK